MAWLGDHALVNDGDVEVELSRQGGSLRGRFNDPRHEKYREKTVRRLAERQLLNKVARDKGWLDTPRFRAAIGRAVAAEVRRKVAAQHEQVTDAEIEAYYAEHANEFRVAARRRVAPALDALPHAVALDQREVMVGDQVGDLGNAAALMRIRAQREHALVTEQRIQLALVLAEALPLSRFEPGGSQSRRAWRPTKPRGWVTQSAENGSLLSRR